MKFYELFEKGKPTVIGMVHLNAKDGESILERAQKEIEIYLKYGIYPLIENYFGSANDCKEVLAWLQQTHPDAIYGINILGGYQQAFRLAKEYGAKFIQIDSVCGHLSPEFDRLYAEELAETRKMADVVLLGGVRFKYQAVNSGRSVAEDLLIGMERCDAIVCTGEGTGLATPIEKVCEFKETVGDFPVIVGAGVTPDTLPETIHKSNGMIVGSWLKDNHHDYGYVSEKHVEQFMQIVQSEQ